jgi:hypothetical protein
MSLRKTWLIGKPRTAVEVEVVAAAAVAVAAVAVAVAAVAAVAAAVAAAAVVAVAAKKVLAAARNNDADVLLICQDIPDKEFCANQKRWVKKSNLFLQIACSYLKLSDKIISVWLNFLMRWHQTTCRSLGPMSCNISFSPSFPFFSRAACVDRPHLYLEYLMARTVLNVEKYYKWSQ